MTLFLEYKDHPATRESSSPTTPSFSLFFSTHSSTPLPPPPLLLFSSSGEYQRGKAALGGSFRLSFRGAITNDIHVTSGGVISNLDIENALNALPTVPGASNVGVTVGEDTTVLNDPRSHLFRITFTIPELQGNVQSIVVVPR